MRTLDALGDSNWAFYREAFGEPPKGNGAASHSIIIEQSAEKQNSGIKPEIKRPER
jgi:hypothetical protein